MGAIRIDNRLYDTESFAKEKDARSAAAHAKKYASRHDVRVTKQGSKWLLCISKNTVR